MILSNKYEMKCTTGPQDIPCRIGSGSGTGPLDCESRDPVPDSENEIRWVMVTTEQLTYYCQSICVAEPLALPRS